MIVDLVKHLSESIINLVWLVLTITMSFVIILPISFVSVTIGLLFLLGNHLGDTNYEIWGDIYGDLRENFRVEARAIPDTPRNKTLTIPEVSLSI